MPPFYKYSYFLLSGLRTRLQGCKINIQQILQVIGEYLTIRPWKVFVFMKQPAPSIVNLKGEGKPQIRSIQK